MPRPPLLSAQPSRPPVPSCGLLTKPRPFLDVFPAPHPWLRSAAAAALLVLSTFMQFVPRGDTCLHRQSGVILHLRADEAHVLGRLLDGRHSAINYLEFGSGGSTKLMAWLTLQPGMRLKVHSVESDSRYAEFVRNGSSYVREAELRGTLHYHVPFNLSTSLWGRPIGWSVDDARRYVEAASPRHGHAMRHGTHPHRFDVIFIDGRYRVACALHALRVAHPNTSVLIHDFVDGLRMPLAHLTRQYQSKTAMFYHLVERTSQLAWLRPRHAALVDARSGANGFQAAYTAALADAARRR